MKKIYLLLLLPLLVLTGCKDPNNNTDTPPVCKITAPANGDVLDLYADLVITGTASDEDGTISKLVLTVDGKVIDAVTEAPFTHTVKAEDLEEKSIKISLSVEDNDKNSANDEVTVTIVDKSLAPTCSITAPEHGAELNVFSPFDITGAAEAVSGEISKVVLKINDDVISEVSSVPFTYTVEAETYDIGMLTINLEVENTRGRSASSMVTVMLADLNIAPVCSITAPEEGTEYEPEDTITITGEGSDEDGTITAAVLKINGNVVPEVTSVPFSYTMTEAQKVPGDITILLEVEDNNGKKATDEVVITILGQFREFTDPRDGKVYKTVKIGSQLWFAENLAYLPEVHPGTEGSNKTDDKKGAFYYVWGYDGTDVAAAKATIQYQEAGALYNWYAIMNGAESMEDRMTVPSGIQGLCPDGWHTPSMGEWWVLQQWCNDQIPDDQGVMYNDSSGTPFNTNEVRLIKNVLVKLKKRDAGWATSNLWMEEFPGSEGQPTDQWGFGMFPAGCRFPSDTPFWYYSGNNSTSAYYWTPDWNTYFPNNPGGSTVSSGNKYELSFSQGASDPSRAYSIRCIKD